MLIIQIEPLASGQHPIQSQSHRTECWVDGYIAVPAELEDEVHSCLGYCDLTMEEGVLTGIIPHPELIPEPESEPTEESVWDELDAAYREGVNTAYDQ